jgi:hypothetical protein
MMMKLEDSEGHKRIMAIMAIPLGEIERMGIGVPDRYGSRPHPLEMAVKEMFDYSYVGTKPIEQERAANYLWARQWFRDDPARVEVANYLDPSNHSVWYRMAQSYSYREITLLCYQHLGSQWFDYFYGEFPESLHPGSAAFDTLVRCLKEGWSEADINNHPIYGIYINVAEYHPNMDRLLRHFPSYRSKT